MPITGVRFAERYTKRNEGQEVGMYFKDRGKSPKEPVVVIDLT